ncbi:HpcH/HpaI aldolase/citrate lyase family protein [Pseudonocardia kujensis]|uniref:HpcH/HpaI aldolase family protein n=1 Tax=Pseudonocardia kujensis TaxID=1128675 RepID=UPI001E361E6A|nr:HpcH/HpaI aldolase/citrate lyase family protein [Pseudonocardia kujensis]MCE0766024.1 HpcH/HpaI aldolase/citrate lyase family protein [Pseudonocardia kujensis]
MSFKQALAEGRPQIGLWLALPSTESTEIVAAAGFDWLVVDGEHGPFDLAVVKSQLLAIAAYPGVEPVVRVPTGLGGYGEAELKRCLDLGARTVLVPMISSADEAREVVRHCRYPQPGVDGSRGVAGARAAAWGRDREYFSRANTDVCVLVQVETVEGLRSLDEIVAVGGVDGVFFGPSDLAASLGLLGRPEAPEVRQAIEDAIGNVRATGKAAGVLTRVPESAARYIDAGATFVAVGTDAGLLVEGSDRLREAF